MEIKYKSKFYQNSIAGEIAIHAAGKIVIPTAEEIVIPTAGEIVTPTADVSTPFLDINKTLTTAKTKDSELYNLILKFISEHPNTVSYYKDLSQSSETITYDRSAARAMALRLNSFQNTPILEELNFIVGSIQEQTRFYEKSQLELNQYIHDIKIKTKILYENIHRANENINNANKLCENMINNKKITDADINNTSKKLSFGLAIGCCVFLSATAIFILPPPFNYISVLAALGPISAGIIRLKSMK